MYPNPRFPHTCKVYRESGGDAFEESTYEVLYEGECRNYITTRNIGDSKVQSSQYTLAIPAYMEIDDDTEIPDWAKETDDEGNETYETYEEEGKTYIRIKVKSFPGDRVSCTDARGKEIVGTVVDCYAGTKGNNVYWNYDAN